MGKADTNSLLSDDATKFSKVLDWMEEVEIQEDDLVFYSGGKRNDALKFVEKNEDYAYFWDIFDEDFQKNFGGVAMDSEATAACSKAMDLHATGETRVFGDKDGKYYLLTCSMVAQQTSILMFILILQEGDSCADVQVGGDDGYWKDIEKPILMKAKYVTKIWSMKDGTTDPNDHPDENTLVTNQAFSKRGPF